MEAVYGEDDLEGRLVLHSQSCRLYSWRLLFSDPRLDHVYYELDLETGPFATELPVGEYEVEVLRVLDMGTDVRIPLTERLSVAEEGATLDIELDLLPVIAGAPSGTSPSGVVVARRIPDGVETYGLWVDGEAQLVLERGVSHSVYAVDWDTYGGNALIAKDVVPEDAGTLLAPRVFALTGELEADGEPPPQLAVVERRDPDTAIWLFPEPSPSTNYSTIVPRGVYDVLLPHPAESARPKDPKGQVAARCVVIE